MNRSNELSEHPGFAGRLAAAFIDSKLTPLVMIASLLLGIMAIALLPREEEPQIKVPMIDVMVSMPGATPKEIEERVSIPMEKLLYELPGVEYIYSTSMPGQCLLVARFYVGEDLENAIVSLNQKLETNFDRIPHGVSMPLIKPHIIDDVPILALTFHSSRYDHYTLRRLAAQVDDALKSIPEVAETKLIGGTRRQVRIQFDPLLLAARNLTVGRPDPADCSRPTASRISGTLQAHEPGDAAADRHLSCLGRGDRPDRGRRLWRQAGLSGRGGHRSSTARRSRTTMSSSAKRRPGQEAAVTLSVAKRPGANAVQVVQTVLSKVESLKGT